MLWTMLWTISGGGHVMFMPGLKALGAHARLMPSQEIPGLSPVGKSPADAGLKEVRMCVEPG